MASEWMKSLFNFMSDNIFIIIYFFALVETFLVAYIFVKMKKFNRSLLDMTDNLLKGFEDAPFKDSNLNVHEKVQNALQFITLKIQTSEKEKLYKNLVKITERPNYNQHYSIEMFASVMSSIVQVFPLLGILGTILAIAQTALSPEGGINAQDLSKAFVLAMDTTILGITFSILFMVVESSFGPKIDRVLEEGKECRDIVSKLLLKDGANEKA